MGSVFSRKDITAQIVVKTRHVETVFNSPAEKRLIEDPYAQYMYLGSSLVSRVGFGMNYMAMNRWMPGLYEMIIGRTRFIDDAVKDAISAGCEQLVILGAGYDTRGFRLEFPPGFNVFEVDQPEVQALKTKYVQKHGMMDSLGRAGVSVNFIPVNFNTQSLDVEIQRAPTFCTNVKTVWILEGVTQYIPKEATAATVSVASRLSPPGSRLIITYVDQNVFDCPQKVGGNAAAVLKICKQAGEPWITAFQVPGGFRDFLAGCSAFTKGYEEMGPDENLSKHWAPLQRIPKSPIAGQERFVVVSRDV